MHKPYGETIHHNAAYDISVPDLQDYSEISDEATYAEADPNRPELYDGGFLPGAKARAVRPEEPAYEESDPNRPRVYDDGFLPGAKAHKLRNKRLSQQPDDDDLDV